MRAVQGVLAAFFQASLRGTSGPGHVIQRQVFALAIGRGRTVAARAQHAGHRAKLRQVLGVVPFVEFGFGCRIDIHRRDQQGTGAGGCGEVTRHKLLAGKAHDAVRHRRDAFGPDRRVLVADRLVGRALQDAE